MLTILNSIAFLAQDAAAPIGNVAAVLGALGVLGVVAIVVLLVKLIQICPPNEVLVISGARSRRDDGREVGYRVVKGGKSVILPLLERVDRMDLTNMAIDVTVKGAYTKGGIPANVSGVANVKIPGSGPVLTKSIERLLGKSRAEIRAIAKDTLEGNLRGVMAGLTPEELNEDKIKFGQRLLDEAEEDLARLGLVLDTLKIQNVWDDVGYLNSIGRIRNSEIQKNAVIAEAEAKSLAAIRDAENRRETEVARIEAQTNSLRAAVAKEITEANTNRAVLVAREEGDVAALVAKAGAELAVQQARVEQTERRLKADVVEPARASMNEQMANARANAATTLEQGAASAEALTAIARTWKAGGANARDAFLFQKIDSLLRLHAGTIGELRVDRLTVLGNGHGAQGNGLDGGSLGMRLARANEEIKAAVGVDVAGLLGSKSPQVTHTTPSAKA